MPDAVISAVQTKHGRSRFHLCVSLKQFLGNAEIGWNTAARLGSVTDQSPHETPAIQLFFNAYLKRATLFLSRKHTENRLHAAFDFGAAQSPLLGSPSLTDCTVLAMKLQ
jgi:hypothetical protein